MGVNLIFLSGGDGIRAYLEHWLEAILRKRRIRVTADEYCVEIQRLHINKISVEIQRGVVEWLKKRWPRGSCVGSELPMNGGVRVRYTVSYDWVYIWGKPSSSTVHVILLSYLESSKTYYMIETDTRNNGFMFVDKRLVRLAPVVKILTIQIPLKFGLLFRGSHHSISDTCEHHCVFLFFLKWYKIHLQRLFSVQNCFIRGLGLSKKL